MKAPVIVAPGHPDNSVTVYLGYGREFAGRVGSRRGLQRLSDPQHLGAVLRHRLDQKIEGKWGMAITKSHYQDHRGKTFGQQGNGNNSLEADEAIGERGIIRYATLDEYKANPGFRATRAKATRRPTSDTSLFPNWEYNEATPGACPST